MEESEKQRPREKIVDDAKKNVAALGKTFRKVGKCDGCSLSIGVEDCLSWGLCVDCYAYVYSKTENAIEFLWDRHS